MKTPLTTALVALLLAATPALCFAVDTDSEPGPQATTDTDDQSSSTPAETGSEQDTPQEEKSDDKKSSDGDLMENFKRHRPGACPEGPPCKAGN